MSMPTMTKEVITEHCVQVGLVDLPPELLTTICVLVGCPTVAWCRLACRRLKDVIDASLELEYQIELARDGMIDGIHHEAARSHCPTLNQVHSQGSRATPNSVLSLVPTRSQAPAATPCVPNTLQTTSDRLARLRELRKAWTALAWTRCVTVPMPGPCSAYELVGGVFCKTQPGLSRGRGLAAGGGAPGGLPLGYGGTEDEWDPDEHGPQGLHGARTMSLTWLPGTTVDATTKVKGNLGVATRDFALDPSQDLMVLFKGGEDAGLPMAVLFPGTLELHVRTISTNQTHPEARVPVLRTTVLYPVTSVFVQIVDDVVGMMYCVDPARPRITIWNWKTGLSVVDRTSGNLPPGVWDFSFINSRALFVTTADGHGTLELFTFTCDSVPVDANANASTTIDPDFHIDANADSLTHVATLHLPLIHPSVRVLSISSHTGPFLAGCPPGASFTSSNRNRIHVLTVQYIHLPTLDGPRTRPRVGIIVHQRAFERYLDRGADAGAGRSEVPWTDWGRTQARMLPHVGLFQWLRYVHGERFVTLLLAKAGESRIQVLDFNVRRAPSADDRGKETDASSQTTLERVDYPTRTAMPNIFVDVVESGLPYHEARRDVRGDYSGVMIDDERLVGLKYPAFLSGDMKEIDVFTL